MADEHCTLPDGCVTDEAKINFLDGKFIPGNDNVFSAYFDVVGHEFRDHLNIDSDFRMYIMSRPKLAVPKEARALLMPEGDDQWPGSDGSNRPQYYPKEAVSGTPFFEQDVDALASELGPSAEEIQEAEAKEVVVEEMKEDEEEEEENEEEAEEFLDYTVWTLLVLSLLMVPVTIFCVTKRLMARTVTPEEKARVAPIHNISALRQKIRTSLMASV